MEDSPINTDFSSALENLGSVLRDAGTKARSDVLRRLQQGISSANDAQCALIVQTLLASIPYLEVTSTAIPIVLFLAVLSKCDKLLKPTTAFLSKECNKLRSSTLAPSHKFSILTFSAAVMGILPSETAIIMVAQAYWAIICSSDKSHTKETATRKLRRTVRITAQKSIPSILESCCNGIDESMSLLLGLAIDVSLRLKVPKDIETVGKVYLKTQKAQIIAYYTRAHILTKNLSEPLAYQSFISFFSDQELFDESDLFKLIDTAEKPVLRSPEIALPPLALVISCSQLSLVNFEKALPMAIANVKSTTSQTRYAAVLLFKAMRIKEDSRAKSTIHELSKNLVQSLTNFHVRESIYQMTNFLNPSKAVVEVLLPYISREVDIPSSLSAIIASLGHHLPACAESFPIGLLEMLSSPKPNLRQSAWAILSRGMTSSNIYFRGIEQPIHNALKTITSQVSNTSCSLIEGYTSITHCLQSGLSSAESEAEAIRCIEIIQDPRSNFLLAPRIYNKISNATEEMSFLGAIASVIKDRLNRKSKINVLGIAQALATLCSKTSCRETRTQIELITESANGILFDGFLVAKPKIPSLILTSLLSPDAPQNMRYDAVLKSILPFHETGSERLWVESAKRMQVDLVLFVKAEWSNIKEIIAQSHENYLLDAVRTLTYVAPELVTASLAECYLNDLELKHFSAIGDKEMVIWASDPSHGPVTDPLQKVAKPSHEHEKMEQWEKDLRAELAAKKKNGQTQLSFAEKNAIAAQLAIEAETRLKVESLRTQRVKAMKLLCLLAETQPEIFSRFSGRGTKLLLAGGKKPYCTLTGLESIETIISFAGYCEQRIKSHQLPLALSVLRSNKTERLTKDLRIESIQSLVSRMLFRIKLISEDQPLDLFSFSFILPLLDKVLQEGGVGSSKQNEGEDTREEQVQLASEIIAAHCTIAQSTLYPRGFMLNSLIYVTSKYSKLSKSSTTALATLGEAMKSNVDILEIKALLKGTLSNQSHTRSACLQAIQPLDLIDYEWFPEIWIGMQDDDEPNARLFLKIWEDNGFDVPSSFSTDLITFMAHPNKYVRRSTSFSIAKACCEHSESVASLLETLKMNYITASKPAQQTLDVYGIPVMKAEVLDRWPERQAIAMTFKAMIPLLFNEQAPPLLDFFVQDGLRDKNVQVRAEMLEAGEKLIEKFGQDLLAELVPRFDLYMSLETNSTSPQNNDHVAEAVIVMFGRLGRFLKNNDERIKSTVSKLIEALDIPSESVQSAVAECLSPLVVMLPDEERGALVSRILTNLIDGEKYSIRRGAAFGLAGTIKGLGISALKDYDILRSIKQAAADSKNPQARQGALFAFETLSLMLGPLFEPYVIQQIPLLLNSFGDGISDVREATTDAARVIMRKISGYCVKVILPSLLEGLNEKQWRSKKGSIELLGSMAFCAPEQLSVALPTIIPRLTDVLTDSHIQVRQAANSSLKHFGEVIHNPEIKELVPVLLKALVDPTNKNFTALSALLTTTFVHYMDSPSLALVVPILERGLKDRSSEAKRKAVQIVGNMASITDTKDFVPYLNRLVPYVMIVLVDPVPETRGTAAKALGTLVERLGEDTFPVLIKDLLHMIKCETSGIDRQGAAQGLSEVLAGLGLERLEDLMPEIILGSSSSKPYVREGFISLLIYLPSTFGNRFAPHLGKIIPPILGGLADDSEYVREASMRASKMIIANYSDKALDLLLPELEEGLQDENWRIRHSCIQLTGDMLFKIAGITGKVETENEDEEEYSASADNARKKLLEVLGRERRDRVLASIYLLRQDVSNTVRVSSLSVWKALVVNTPRTVREVLSYIVGQTVRLLGSDFLDLQEAASRTLSELCRKLGDKVLGDIFSQLLTLSSSDNEQSREGVCIAFVQILKNVSEEDLEAHTSNIIECVRAGLVDKSSRVRSAAAEAFDAMQVCMGPKAIDGVIPTLLDSLRNPGEHSEAALKALKEVMAVRSTVVFPALVPSLIKQPISAFGAHALATLITVSGPALTPRIVRILTELQLALQSSTDSELIANINEANTACMSALKDDGLHILMMMLIEWVKHVNPENRVAGLRLFTLFCQNTSLNIEMYRIDWIRQLISLLDDREESVGDASWQALDAFLQTVRKEENDSLVIPLCNAMESTGSPGHYVKGISKPGRLTPIVAVALQSLLAGTNDQRAFSASLIRLLVSRTAPESLKPYTIQLVGPLIRVLGEKFPVTVKIRIVQALKTFLDEVATFIKPFLPQLQRSFMKTIIDPTSLLLRSISAEALGSLMVTQPRADPVVNELLTIITAETTDSAVRLSSIEGLTCVIKSAQANVTEPIQDKVAQFLLTCTSSDYSVPSTSFHAVADLAICLLKLGKHEKLQEYFLQNCPFSLLSVTCVSEMAKSMKDIQAEAVKRLSEWKSAAQDNPVALKMIREAEKLER